MLSRPSFCGKDSQYIAKYIYCQQKFYLFNFQLGKNQFYLKQQHISVQLSKQNVFSGLFLNYLCVFVIIFSQTPFIMILRKHTIPNKKGNLKQPRCSISKPHNNQQSEILRSQHFQCKSGTHDKIQLSKITEKAEKHPLQALNSNQSITQDVEKLINKNKLTIDLVGQETPSTNQLPEVATFQKMKNLLVSSPLYRQYSEKMMKKGENYSLLEKLELQYDMAAAKIRIHKYSEKKVRNSRFQTNDQQKALGQTDKVELTPLKERYSCINISKSHNLSNQKIRETGYRLTGFSSKDGWRLKDFYSHIQTEWQGDNSRAKKFKQRQNIISKLKKINEQCQALQDNSSEIIKSIDVFAKYNENLSQKLSRRHRKINKVYYSQHY